MMTPISGFMSFPRMRSLLRSAAKVRRRLLGSAMASLHFCYIPLWGIYFLFLVSVKPKRILKVLLFFLNMVLRGV